MSQDFKQAALDYHEFPRPGKISVELSTPAETSRDLSLAYSPGVAEPVREGQELLLPDEELLLPRESD